jgi:ketosteroid isomerase-like protein
MRGQRGMSKGHSRNLYLDRELIYSVPFRQLKGMGKDVVLLFWAKRQMAKTKRKGEKKWVCENDGRIVFTYTEAERYGISGRQFHYALDQAVRAGFVDIEHKGSGLLKDPSLYSISDRWQAWGTNNFEWNQREKDMRGIGFRDEKRRFRAVETKNITHADVCGTTHAHVCYEHDNQDSTTHADVCRETATPKRRQVKRQHELTART